MKVKKKQAESAGKLALICLLVFTAIFTGLSGFFKGGQAQAAEKMQRDSEHGAIHAEVELEASYGYDNMAKGGRYLPVYVTLTNQREGEFAGTLQVLSMESDYRIYQYEFPVQLNAGETSQQNLNIPLGVRADQLYVSLLDEKDKKIAQKRLKLNTREDIPELLVGVISDTQDKLQYFNDIGVNYSTLRTRLCKMVAGSVPSQAAGLDQLDVLLITNYDTRRLSEAQLAAIREWVNRGGVLILGTGARGCDNLYDFLEDDLDGTPVFMGEIPVDMGEGYLFSKTGDSKVLLACNDINLSEGNVLMESGGIPLLTSVARESGIIVAAAFDFADLEEFCLENPSYVDQLFTRILGETRITRLSDYLYVGTSNTYWSVQSIINAGSVEELPHIGLYAVVIVSYILLAGPGLYFFLKQRGMRGYYRTGVVLLSLLCTGIVYVMSSNTRFTNTFFNYASIQDISEEVVTETTYVNMQTPDNRPYSVQFDADYTVRPITRSAYYEAEQIPKFTGQETPNILIHYGEESTRLDVRNVPAFASNYFQLEKRFDNVSGQGIEARVQYFEGKVTGTITNHMDCRIENTAVVLYGTLVLVGDMEPGETKQLDGQSVLNYSVDAGASRATAEQITGVGKYKKADISNIEYMRTMAKTSLLEFYLHEYLTGYQPGARIIAFRGEEPSDSFLTGDSYDVSGLTMLTAAAEADMRQGERVYRSAMRTAPRIINGTYQTSGNTILGTNPVTLEYSLGSDLEIERLRFEYMSAEFKDNALLGQIRPFEGSIYFYNYESGEYDLINNSRMVFEAWQLEPYLSPGHTISVRYVCDSAMEYGTIVLPILYVTGREI